MLRYYIAIVLNFLFMVPSTSTLATAREFKDHSLVFTVENDALLGNVVRMNALTCVKTPAFSATIEKRDPRTLEWRWVSHIDFPAISMEAEQSLKLPSRVKNLEAGLYRLSVQNLLTQAGNGSCGTRRFDWTSIYQTESIIFGVDSRGAISAPKEQNIHRILAVDEIAYLDRAARFAVISPEPFVLTLYQEWGSEKFVFRQVTIEDVLISGRWSQLNIERLFPESFRQDLPVRYVMTGTRSGTTVFGVFAPNIE